MPSSSIGRNSEILKDQNKITKLFPLIVSIFLVVKEHAFSPQNVIRLLKNCGLVRREHEPSGRPKSLLLSENRDTIVTTNIYL